MNKHLYGESYGSKDIVTSGLAVPEAGKDLISMLNKYSGRKGRVAAVKTAQQNPPAEQQTSPVEPENSFAAEQTAPSAQ